MSEYYAVQRSGTSLAHYGVKGMKWGVRKAISRRNDRALSRQYRKAEKKLAKLQLRANSKHQMNVAKSAQRARRIAAAVGAADIGVQTARTVRSVKGALNQALKTGYGRGNIYLPVGAALAAGSMIGNSIRRSKAIKRATGAGHQKAVQKEKEFRNEMRKTFKGTKYASQIGKQANKISKQKQERTISRLSPADQAVLRKKKRKG